MIGDFINRLRMPRIRLVMPDKVDRSRATMAATRPTEEELLELARSTHVIDPLPVDPNAFAVRVMPDPQLPPRAIKILEENGEIVIRRNPQEG